MNNIQQLARMIREHFDNEFKYTEDEFLNQLSKILVEYKDKCKEIGLKEAYIEDLEYKVIYYKGKYEHILGIR